MFKKDNKDKEEVKQRIEVEKSDISIKDFVEYIKKNSILIILTFIILFLSHSYILLNSNVGIDTESMINNPTGNYNWYEIGRFGLVWEKHILNLSKFSMFYAEAIGFAFLILFCIVFYYAIYKFSGKDIGLANLILPLACFTSPIWAEQFVFLIQIAEIAFSMFLLVVGLLLIYKWIIDKSWVSSIVGCILLMIAFASYQSFLVVYIAMCIFSFMLLFNNEKYNSYFKKDLIKICIKLVVSFLISFGLYGIICKMYVEEVSYLNGSNAWHYMTSRREIVKNIFNHCKSIIKGEGIFYNIGLLIYLIGILVLNIYSLIKDEDSKLNKFLRLMITFAFLSTPFIFTVYIGQASVVRGEIYIPVIESLAVLYLVTNIKTNKEVVNNIVKILSVVLVLWITSYQAYFLESLYYTDKLTRQKDYEIASQLAHDMKEAGINDNDTVFFYGHYDGIDNNSTIKGQVIGQSSFEFNHTLEPMYYCSTQTIVYLMRSMGYKYLWLPMDRVFDARVTAAPETVPSWPKEGSIIKCEDYYIVKINGF